MILDKSCSVCAGKMVKVVNSSSISVVRETSGMMSDTFDTSKYMCTNCGYIEEYADISKFKK